MAKNNELDVCFNGEKRIVEQKSIEQTKWKRTMDQMYVLMGRTEGVT